MKMRNILFSSITAALLICSAVSNAMASGFELGVGANYWYSIDEAKEKSFDRDGLGWMVSSRIMFSDVFGIALEIEQTPDNFVALEDKMYLPAAYAILGNGIYLGLGVGTYYYDNEFSSDPWYALRAGFKIPIISRSLLLDINVNYRVENWDGIKDVSDNIDTDTLMIGAALRLAF